MIKIRSLNFTDSTHYVDHGFMINGNITNATATDYVKEMMSGDKLLWFFLYCNRYSKSFDIVHYGHLQSCEDSFLY